MKKLVWSACIVFGSVVPMVVSAQTLVGQLSGRIVLQVEEHGEAWYVDPTTQTRWYLGRPADAFQLMRSKGLGIRHVELTRYRATRFSLRLAGRIVLDVEQHGEAYYVLPGTLRGVFLGRPVDAFQVMRTYGLGITNANLGRIPIGGSRASSGAVSAEAAPEDASLHVLERQAFDAVNNHRRSIGFAALVWNDTIAAIARGHSGEMANGKVSFGHDGFQQRIDAIASTIPLNAAAENVAYNNFPDPVKTAVEGWLASPGHRENIETSEYTQTGIGVAKSPDGKYYFTQVFITAR